MAKLEDMTVHITTDATGLRANGVRAVPGEPLRLERAATFVRETVNAEARTVELSFSSEEPYERWFGIEILGHAPGECDLTWLTGGRAPLLVDHRPSDLVGVVETAAIGADRKGRAVVRFGKSPRAEEVLTDIRDGIRSNVSVGYQIDELQLIASDGDDDTYRVTKWRPLEISLVSIPADMTVGVGKSGEDRAALLRQLDLVIVTPQPERTSMEKTTTTTAAPVPAAVATAASPADLEQATAAARAAEQARVSNIMALAERWNMRDFGIEHVGKGTSLELFRGLVLEKIPQGKPLYAPAAALGLSAQETRRYSLRAAMVAGLRAQGIALGDPKDGAFELECHNALVGQVQRAGQQLKGGILIPHEPTVAQIGSDMRPEDLQRALETYRATVAGLMLRDQTVGTASQGGNLVATNLLAASFIDLLRNVMKVRQLGATVLDGLVGNVAIPKQTSAATAGWQTESGATAESQAAFGQVTLSPKHINAQVDMTRQLLLQSTPSIEALIRMDLALVLAIAIDLAALHGTGAANQPTGIAATAGIGSVAGGTNGAAPTWDNIVDLESAVANANALNEDGAYLTNTKVRGKLKRTQRFASTNGDPIWDLRSDYRPDGQMNERRAAVSNQVSSTLTKGTSVGVCSAIFFGNWRDLLIGEWGALELLANPYSQAGAGILQMHAYQTVDIAVRRAESFAAMLDALTV